MKELHICAYTNTLCLLEVYYMCDLNREFELQIWRDSIEFGKINKGTLSFSNVSENNKEIKIKGEINLPARTLPGGIFSLHGAGESCTIKAKER